MKAIFCDIDGVLNHQHDKEKDYSQMERFGFAADLVRNLKTVIDAVPDAKLVISSSWRAFHDNMGMSDILPEGDWRVTLAEMLGIDASGICSAPTLHEFACGSPNVSGAKGRAHDILLWLSEHGNGDSYVILDDECKTLKKWLGGHVVDCAEDKPHGLTDARAQAAIAILKAGHDVPKPKTECGCEGGC